MKNEQDTEPKIICGWKNQINGTTETFKRHSDIGRDFFWKRNVKYFTTTFKNSIITTHHIFFSTIVLTNILKRQSKFSYQFNKTN